MFYFIHILTDICYLLSYCDSHPNRCEVASHCGFDLHSSNYWWCWVTFPEQSSSISSLMSCNSSLYVLDINPYSIYGLLILFFFLCRSFPVSLITFVNFCICCLGAISKNIIARSKVKWFLPNAFQLGVSW